MPDGARDCKFHKFWVWDLESVVNALSIPSQNWTVSLNKFSRASIKVSGMPVLVKKELIRVDEKNTYVIRKLRYQQYFYFRHTTFSQRLGHKITQIT